ERLDDLVLSAVQVLQFVDEQLFQWIDLFRHSFPPVRPTYRGVMLEPASRVRCRATYTHAARLITAIEGPVPLRATRGRDSWLQGLKRVSAPQTATTAT